MKVVAQITTFKKKKKEKKTQQKFYKSREQLSVEY